MGSPKQNDFKLPALLLFFFSPGLKAPNLIFLLLAEEKKQGATADKFFRNLILGTVHEHHFEKGIVNLPSPRNC